MLKQALQKAKKVEDKKVSINFQVPASLKEEFDNLCRTNSVSLTAMLNSLMEVALDESKGLINNDVDINELQSKLMSMHELIEKNVGEQEVGFNPYIVKKAVENQLKNIAGIEPDIE